MSKNQDTQIANLQMDIHVCVWNLKYINIYKAKLHVHWTIYVTVNEYTVTLTFQIYKQAGYWFQKQKNGLTPKDIFQKQRGKNNDAGIQ